MPQAVRSPAQQVLLKDRLIYNEAGYAEPQNQALRLKTLGVQALFAKYKDQLPPAQLAHQLWNAFWSNERNHWIRIVPRQCIQKAYDMLWQPEDRDESEAAVKSRNVDFPQIIQPNSLSFLAMIFVQLAFGASYYKASVGRELVRLRIWNSS